MEWMKTQTSISLLAFLPRAQDPSICGHNPLSGDIKGNSTRFETPQLEFLD